MLLLLMLCLELPLSSSLIHDPGKERLSLEGISDRGQPSPWSQGDCQTMFHEGKPPDVAANLPAACGLC